MKSPHRDQTETEISLLKNYFWKYLSAVWGILLQVTDGDN